MCRALVASRARGGATDAKAKGLGLQRSDSGAGAVSAEEFEDEITEDVSEPETEGRGVTLDDFFAYMPMHVYIFTPCREIWVGASINARLSRMRVLDQY